MVIKKVQKNFWPRTKDQLVLAANPVFIQKLGLKAGNKKQLGTAATVTLVGQCSLCVNLLLGGATLIALRFTKADRARTLISRTVGVTMFAFSSVPIYCVGIGSYYLSHYEMSDLKNL